MIEIATNLVPADTTAAETAARILGGGGLVAFPTETVYGLGADATNGEAVARLYAAKGRPSFNPLISHVVDIAAARKIARFNDVAEKLARAFWPGPLTLVLSKTGDCPVSDLATAGLDSIAIRVPNHPVARELLSIFGKPIVAPSANRSGHVSPTTAQHVMEDLTGRINFIIDGGPTKVGVESTIVSCLGGAFMLLRAGGIARADIERVIGAPLEDPALPVDLAAPIAPGMLASHYAPNASLRLDATRIEPGEALLAFGPPLTGAAITLNLSARGDLTEAAANLFSHLRALDGKAAKIAVMPVPNEGLGEAINDRLARAAAPKD
jgi:L-threonylcarbamoyladenylate synthase